MSRYDIIGRHGGGGGGRGGSGRGGGGFRGGRGFRGGHGFRGRGFQGFSRGFGRPWGGLGWGWGGWPGWWGGWPGYTYPGLSSSYFVRLQNQLPPELLQLFNTWQEAEAAGDEPRAQAAKMAFMTAFMQAYARQA